MKLKLYLVFSARSPDTAIFSALHFKKFYFTTSMNSSRMRTARLLTVSRSIRGGGEVSVQGVVSAQRGCLPRWGVYLGGGVCPGGGVCLGEVST